VNATSPIRNRDGHLSETARVIRGDDFLALTADQLREAIRNGENEPRVVRDGDGKFYLINAEFRGFPSNNYNPHETEVILYEDGSFETIDEDDEDEEEAYE
jgi:hypothetical protein